MVRSLRWANKGKIKLPSDAQVRAKRLAESPSMAASKRTHVAEGSKTDDVQFTEATGDDEWTDVGYQSDDDISDNFKTLTAVTVSSINDPSSSRMTTLRASDHALQAFDETELAADILDASNEEHAVVYNKEDD